MNYTDLQAAIWRVQLGRLEEMGATRLGIARRYAQELPRVHPGIRMQRDLCAPSHARHLFQVRLPVEALPHSRNELLLELRARGIGASVHYAPLHLMPLYADAGAPALPATEDLARRLLTLPISASMTVADADRVLEQLAGALP
jgi:dTDP-4-amino-4,6-dideoxygalactose transaminase